MGNIASISAVQYELGDFIKIDELDFLVSDQEKLKMYQNAGLANYVKTNLDPMDLCFTSLSKTLDQIKVEKEDIDFLIFTSENAKRDYSLGIRDANRLQIRLGLKKAQPIGVSLSECANVITGMQLGASLITSKMAKNVLLVCFDKLPESDIRRRMPHEMSILSDGAVSCLISEPGSGDFDIQSITHKNMATQWDYFGSESNNMYSMQKLKSLVGVTKRILKENAVETKDIKKIFTSNYAQSIAKMFIEISGFKEEQGYYANIERFAHTLAGDILINLKDYMDESPLSAGEKVFMLIDSFSSCGSIILTKN